MGASFWFGFSLNILNKNKSGGKKDSEKHLGGWAPSAGQGPSPGPAQQEVSWAAGHSVDQPL